MYKKGLFRIMLWVFMAVAITSALLMNNPNYNLPLYKYYANGISYLYTRFSTKFFDQPYPVGYLSKKDFDAKLAHPAAWIQTQIDRDFSHYSDCSKENVIATYQAFPAKDLVILFEIDNGKLTVIRKDIVLNGTCTNGLKIYTNIFEYLAKKGYVKKLRFLLRLSDFIAHASDQKVADSAPILTTSKDLSESKEQKFILIPDYMSLEEIPKMVPRILHANKLFPWKRKEDKILWRGGYADISGFRHQVVAFGEAHPDSRIDAKFVVEQGEFVLPEMQVKAKFLLTIDGHTAAWNRPIWQLLSNSVVLKQDSPITQWYYAALEPGVDYIPVPNDAHQLEAILSRYTDAQLQAIANHGSDFAKNNLMFDDMMAYIVQVLRTYESLQAKK